MQWEKSENSEPPKTFFAPAWRSGEPELKEEVKLLSRNPIIDIVLKSVGGLLAVLNKNRQILTVNKSFLDMLGIEDAVKVLGLRPGEAIKCIHAFDFQEGCGTSKFCSTCGAAIAITSALAVNKVEERDCIATLMKNGANIDMFFKVRAYPLILENNPLILLFIQDYTCHHKRESIERSFFHDVSNMLTGLIGMTELYNFQHNDEGRNNVLLKIQNISNRILKEVEIQRAIMKSETGSYLINIQPIYMEDIVMEIKDIISYHPSARSRNILLPSVIPQYDLKTDRSIVIRIVTNMLINALEASEEGETIQLWFESDENYLCFCVWNKKYMPENVRMRIFQRHFSTKKEPGRGFGTFSMKLFSENYLGGKVTFSSSETSGTTFRLCLPRI